MENRTYIFAAHSGRTVLHGERNAAAKNCCGFLQNSCVHEGTHFISPQTTVTHVGQWTTKQALVQYE